jgi:hypothetical protein
VVDDVVVVDGYVVVVELEIVEEVVVVEEQAPHPVRDIAHVLVAAQQY